MMHDLLQHTGYLRSALQQDRRPLGLLLGAGTSMSIDVDGAPLVPDMARMAEVVEARLAGKDAEVVRSAREQIAETVQAPTLEDILSYLRTLADVPGSQDLRGFSPEELRSAEVSVCAAISDSLDVQLPASGTSFHALALWIRAATRHAPVQIFTTNYDLLVEEALEQLGVPFFDGFVGSSQPRFDLQAVEEDEIPIRWARLWKLHGSVNWRTTQDGAVVRSLKKDALGRTLIYPSNLKYAQSRRMPYLALMDRIKGFLRQPSAIVVSSGFAFRDAHINEAIEQGLRANPTAAVQALLFGNLCEYPEAIEMATRSPNMALLARDEAVIGTKRGMWTGVDETTECSLGDFTNFGEMLRGVIGEASVSSPTSVGEG